jgi:phosphohistidine phosphatase SixA
MSNYVLLVRHASRERKWDLPESEHPMKAWKEDLCAPTISQSVFSDFWCKAPAAEPDKQVLPITCSLAGQLCDQLEMDNIIVSRIFHSKHKVATQTAKVFAQVLGKRGRLDIQAPGQHADYDSLLLRRLALTPDDAKTPKKAKATPKEKDKKVIDRVTRRSLNYLVIGHQPQLSRIARGLLDKSLMESNPLKKVWLKLKNRVLFGYSLPSQVLPIGSSEIACIKLGKNPRLMWLLTEKSPELLAELKMKIASKYEVAKFFLGALVVGTGLTLSDAVWNLSNRNAKLVAGIGAFAALVSLGLTAATLFSYDRLLMPQDFWLGKDKDEGSQSWLRRVCGVESQWSVSRPPSQAHVILFYEMVHIWTCLFTPAMISAFVAVGLVVAARAHNSLTVPAFSGTPLMVQEHPLITLLLVALFAFVLGFLAFLRFKPSLGFDD